MIQSAQQKSPEIKTAIRHRSKATDQEVIDAPRGTNGPLLPFHDSRQCRVSSLISGHSLQARSCFELMSI